MHPNLKGLREPDFTEHPAEKELLKAVSGAHGVDGKLVKDARAAGIPWETILGWLVQFGSLFNEFLQAVLAALHTPPPETEDREVRDRQHALREQAHQARQAARERGAEEQKKKDEEERKKEKKGKEGEEGGAGRMNAGGHTVKASDSDAAKMA